MMYFSSTEIYFSDEQKEINQNLTQLSRRFQNLYIEFQVLVYRSMTLAEYA